MIFLLAQFLFLLSLSIYWERKQIKIKSKGVLTKLFNPLTRGDLQANRARIFLEITYGTEFIKSLSKEEYLTMIEETIVEDSDKEKKEHSFGNNHINEIILPFNLVDGRRVPSPRISNSRLGQDKFKRDLLKAYNFKCCISGNENVELLEAAHIQEYKGMLSNHIQNGLLLRVDIHRLFDSNLIAIDGNYKIIVSHLAPDYKHFNGKEISLPIKPDFYPSKLALTHHQIKLLTNSLVDTGNVN